MAILLVTIFIIAIGIKYINKSEIATVTGTITTPEAGSSDISSNVDINYPTGFNLQNCMVISLMAKNTGLSTEYWSTVGSTGHSVEAMYGCYGLWAVMGPNHIRVHVSKVHTEESQKTINVKLVLLKTN